MHFRSATFGKTFRAFFAQQNLQRFHDDLEIQKKAELGNVHKIHFELVKGGCVVFPIYLRVAGKSAFNLVPELKFWDLFCVDLHVFNALRTWASRLSSRNKKQKTAAERLYM